MSVGMGGVRRFFALGVVCAGLFSAQPGMALVGGSVDANTATSDWTGVVSITINGGSASGVLIGSEYILTAAHVVAGFSANSISVNFNIGSDLSQSILASSVTVHPGYNGTAVGSDFFWHDDLAIIKLSSAASSGAKIYSLFSGSLSSGTSFTNSSTGNVSGTNGSTVTLVGYAGSASVKKVGQNTIGAVVADDDASGSAGYTGQTEILIYDYDGGAAATNVLGSATPVSGEALYQGGDSGSPMFVQVGGVWQVAGIASFVGDTSKSVDSASPGAIGGATSVAAYADWINSVTAVPEPQSYVMMLGGLMLLGACAQRRRA